MTQASPISGLLALFAALAVAGCGKYGPPQRIHPVRAAPPPAAVPAPQPAPVPAPPAAAVPSGADPQPVPDPGSAGPAEEPEAEPAGDEADDRGEGGTPVP